VKARWAAVSKQIARLGDLLRDNVKRTDASRDELKKVRRELADLRREVHERLLQNTMTRTRAARALESGALNGAGAGDVRRSSRPVSVETPEGAAEFDERGQMRIVTP
jgi:DNA gyrase/topoisomerase IV subunit A